MGSWPPASFKKGEEGRKKKEVLYLSRCYTHTHKHTHRETQTQTHTQTHTHRHTQTHTQTHITHSHAQYSLTQVVGCTPWRLLVSAALPVAFAWQAWGLVHCRGSDVPPGVAWSPPLAGGFCVAGAVLGALQGVGCTPWHPLVSAAPPVAFASQAWDLVHCKGSGVRPGVPWSPPLCR